MSPRNKASIASGNRRSSASAVNAAMVSWVARWREKSIKRPPTAKLMASKRPVPAAMSRR